MRTPNNRGIAEVAVILVLAGVAAVGLIPNFRPWNWFHSKPPTVALAKAEDQLAKAKADQAAIDAKVKAAVEAEHAKTVDQLRYAQEMGHGAETALTRVPETSRGPELALGLSLIARTNIGLAMAIGSLPQPQRDEIAKIVDQALSKAQAAVDEANRALAVKDAALQATQTEKLHLQTDVIPALTRQQEAAAAKAQQADAAVNAKTHEVAAYADKLAAKEREAGSFSANVWRICALLALLYLVIHFTIPSLAQEFPGSQILRTIDKGLKSIFSAHL